MEHHAWPVCWQGHPFVDPEVNERLVSQGCLPRANLFRMDPQHPDVPYYPTFHNWMDIEPARQVVEDVQAANARIKARYELRYPGQRTPSHYLRDPDQCLLNCHRVFQPADEGPESKASRRQIRKFHKARRTRWAMVLELFHRANQYDIPEGPLGDLTRRRLTSWGAPIVGVPDSDVYIQDLRAALLDPEKRQPPTSSSN